VRIVSWGSERGIFNRKDLRISLALNACGKRLCGICTVFKGIAAGLEPHVLQGSRNQANLYRDDFAPLIG
jgi:hypothetical protein